MSEMELVSPDEAALRRRRGDYDPEQVRLIKATVAEGATDAELAMFLELSARYGLDPFAREIWCVKGSRRDGSPGRILIMVGRDGLRKLAKRARARVDQDVVREQDSFSVKRLPDGKREVEHGYNGSQSARGEIVGAWCEVVTEDSYGFFYAPLEEYLPTSEAKLKWSPWGSQRSVMILAAAERQALRMAIPLSGVLVEGEMDLAQERAQGAGDDGQAEVGWPSEAAQRELEPLFNGMNAVAPHSYGPASVDLLVRGQTLEALALLRQRLERELSDLVASATPQEEVVRDAEIVPDSPQTPRDDASAPSESPQPDPEPARPVAGGESLSSMLAAQESQAAAPKEPVQQEIGGQLRGDGEAGALPEPATHPEADPTAIEPEPAPEPEPPAATVPGGDLDDLRADLAYWHDVLADEEYRSQQGLSEEQVQASIAELTSAIDALEGQQ